MTYAFHTSAQCPITQALHRAGIKLYSVTNQLKPSNFMLPWITLYPNEEHYTSQHSVAIANRRIVGMQVKHGMFKLNGQNDTEKIELETPADINIEFEVPDDFMQKYS